jgi:hypothetical protein
MGQRLDLHTLLLTITPNVYFQPPATLKMTYPCIVYHRDYKNTEFADGRPYKHRKRYQVMVIAEDPDSGIPDQVAEIPMCLFDRFYTAHNLNHDVFKLFF